MRPFRELRVWQLAHELTLDVYRLTNTFPSEERFGVTSQVRRAASSVPFNIVEGSARSDAEFLHFLRIALGSATEVEYALLLSRDLGYLSPADYTLVDEKLLSIKRMLVTFMKTVDPQRAAANRGVTTTGGAAPQRPTANRQQPTGAAPQRPTANGQQP